MRSWDIPAINKNGVILIPSDYASKCIEKIYESSYQLLGFDAFILLENGAIQPSMEFSADYSNGVPSIDEVHNLLINAPDEITHYEFVFKLIHDCN